MKLKKRKRVVAIVPSAGKGKRFVKGKNKPFISLNDKPVVIWCLETLESIAEICEIIPVLKEEDMEMGMELFEKYNISKIKKISPGGKERQDSVYNGLRLIDDAGCLVLIHDGVRPFIEKRQVEEMIREMSESVFKKDGCDGVVFGVPIKDTVKEAEKGIVKRTLQRGSLWAIQTPQIFSYKKIIRAFENAIREGYYATDEASLIERYNGKVKIMMGSYTNIKITTPEDIAFAEFLLTKREKIISIQ